MHRNARGMSESCSSNLEDEMVKETTLNSGQLGNAPSGSAHCHFFPVWVCYHQGKIGHKHSRQAWDVKLLPSVRVGDSNRGRLDTKEMCALFFFRTIWT